MKIQIFSDLHVDVSSIKPISIMLGVDLVIVAGDTCEGVLHAFDYLRQIVAVHIPILMVFGNHEYYRRFIPHDKKVCRRCDKQWELRIGGRFPLSEACPMPPILSLLAVKCHRVDRTVPKKELPMLWLAKMAICR